MAVQRNFVVRNGLEVNTSLVFTDTDNQRVGIGSTQPTTNLDVKLGGIAGTDLYMAGLSTFMNDLDCNASVVISAGASVAGFTTFTNIVQTGSGATVGFGTSVFIASGDLTIHSGDVVVGHGLSVSGISTFNGDIDLNDSLIVSMGASIAGFTTFNNTVQTGSGATVGFGTSAFISFGDLTIHQGDAVIGHGLSVAGVSTFNGRIDGQNGQRSVLVGTGLSVAGITTLAGSGGITTTGGQLYVGSDLSVGGASTFTGVGTFASDLYVGGDLFINENITLDTNLNILGVATIGTLHVTGNGKIDGVLRGENDTRALQVGTGVSIAGITTLAGGGGITTTGGDLFVGGDIFVSDNITLDTNLNILGIATIGTLHVTGNGKIDGVLNGENDVRALQVGTGISIAGITTLAGGGGITTTGGDLHVGGDLFIQDNVTLDTNLNLLGIATIGTLVVTGLATAHEFKATGFSTFSGDVDIDAGLDVDGHTELDDVNVSGASTFAGLVDANAGAHIDNLRLGIGADNEITTSSGNLNLDSAGGTVDVNADLKVSGVSTFVGFSTFNDYVIVQDGLNVTGVVTATTFDGDVTGNVTGDVTGGTIVGSALSISGIGTINTTLHVGVGGTVLQASEDGTIALGSGTTAATVTLNGGSIPSIGLVIALGG